MVTSTLAGIMGPLFVVMGISVMADPKRIQKLDGLLLKHDEELYLTGSSVMLLGLIMVQFHNAWFTFVEATISFLAWLMIVKGAVLMLFPQAVKNLYNKCFKKMPPQRYLAVGIFITFLGIFLSYYAWQ